MGTLAARPDSLTDKRGATGSVTNAFESPETLPESAAEGGSLRRLGRAHWLSDSFGVASIRREGLRDDQVRLRAVSTDEQHADLRPGDTLVV